MRMQHNAPPWPDEMPGKHMSRDATNLQTKAIKRGKQRALGEEEGRDAAHTPARI